MAATPWCGRHGSCTWTRFLGAASLRSPWRAVVDPDEPRTAVSLASIVTCLPCRSLRRSLVLDASADSSRRRLGGHVLCYDALRLCSPRGESAGALTFAERLC